MNSFLSENELSQIPFSKIGKNVHISRHCSIYGAEKIELGENVRIDDFCILSGKIRIDNNIHIAAYSALYGGEAGINVSNYANISSRVCIYAVSDDYSGGSMTNPTIPDRYKHVINEPVYIGRHVIIGSGCIILPGVRLEEGTALGAMSLCKQSTQPWKIYAGIPAKIIKDRSRELLKYEKEFENDSNKCYSLINAGIR